MTFSLLRFMLSKPLGLALVAAIACGAAQAQQPKVDYSADWRMETSDGAQTGKVYHSAGLERRELDEGGEKIVLIARPDKKVMWNLIPSEKMYMEMAQGKDKARKDDLSQYDIEQTPAGEETLNGVRTSKSKVIMKERKPNGAKLGGFWWMTREGVMVKMDMLSIEKGSKERIKMELSNLKTGKQDPKLFEIPAGYEKMSGLGDLGKMMTGGDKDDDDDDDKPAKGKAKGEKKEGFGVKDVLKILR